MGNSMTEIQRLALHLCTWLTLVTPPVLGFDEESDGAETSQAEDAGAVTLRYNFQRGQYVHYEVESREMMKLTARNSTTTLDQSRRTKKHFRVVTVDESGGAILEPVIDEVQMQVKTNGRDPVVYDSRNPAEDLPKAFDDLNEKVGKASLRVRFFANGRVEKVLGPEDEEEEASFLVALPDEDVRPGDTWDDDYTIRVDVDPLLRVKQEFAIRRKYTLDKVEDGIAHISFRTYPLWNGRDPHVLAQLIAQRLIGRVRFDIARGLILESRSASEGHVVNAFGPNSSMKSSTNRAERFVTPKRRNKGPAGPQLPGA